MFPGAVFEASKQESQQFCFLLILCIESNIWYRYLEWTGGKKPCLPASRFKLESTIIPIPYTVCYCSASCLGIPIIVLLFWISFFSEKTVINWLYATCPASNDITTKVATSWRVRTVFPSGVCREQNKKKRSEYVSFIHQVTGNTM